MAQWVPSREELSYHADEFGRIQPSPGVTEIDPNTMGPMPPKQLPQQAPAPNGTPQEGSTLSDAHMRRLAQLAAIYDNVDPTFAQQLRKQLAQGGYQGQQQMTVPGLTLDPRQMKVPGLAFNIDSQTGQATQARPRNQNARKAITPYVNDMFDTLMARLNR